MSNQLKQCKVCTNQTTNTYCSECSKKARFIYRKVTDLGKVKNYDLAYGWSLTKGFNPLACKLCNSKFHYDSENKHECEKHYQKWERYFKEIFSCLACKQAISKEEIGKHSCSQMKEKSFTDYVEEEFIRQIDKAYMDSGSLPSDCFKKCVVCSRGEETIEISIYQATEVKIGLRIFQKIIPLLPAKYHAKAETLEQKLIELEKLENSAMKKFLKFLKEKAEEKGNEFKLVIFLNRNLCESCFKSAENKVQYEQELVNKSKDNIFGKAEKGVFYDWIGVAGTLFDKDSEGEKVLGNIEEEQLLFEAIKEVAKENFLELKSFLEPQSQLTEEDFTQIKQYFLDNKIKQISLTNSQDLLIEYQNGTSKTISANTQQLRQIKSYLQSQGKQSISQQDLKLQTNQSKTSWVPWIIGGILGAGLIIGLAVWLVWRSKRKNAKN